MGLDGIEIFANGSCSHHELRKLQRRMMFIQGATTKVGGVYLYANFQGCDGSNLYFDGSPLIALNGNCLVQGTQFSIKDYEVIAASIDLDDVRSYRGINRSIGFQSSHAPAYPRIKIDFSLEPQIFFHPTQISCMFYHSPEEEIRLGPACWLWDYLRRSKAKGFLVPLSGGLDSAAVATIVYSMCCLISEGVSKGDKQVISDLEDIMGSGYVQNSKKMVEPKDISKAILHTLAGISAFLLGGIFHLAWNSYYETMLMVTTCVITACVSSALCGIITIWAIIFSWRLKIDPDNIATPIAASLGDLITLFFLAMFGDIFYRSHENPVLSLIFVFLIGSFPFWLNILRNNFLKSITYVANMPSSFSASWC